MLDIKIGFVVLLKYRPRLRKNNMAKRNGSEYEGAEIENQVSVDEETSSNDGKFLRGIRASITPAALGLLESLEENSKVERGVLIEMAIMSLYQASKEDKNRLLKEVYSNMALERFTF
jgi:hypothetical protein